MAKPQAPGTYSPWNWRARRLISQLRSATHRTVQNAIIAELLHELEKGSRRIRRKTSQWRQVVKNQLHTAVRLQGGRTVSVVRKRAAELKRRVRYGPQMTCDACPGKEFRNKLEAKAHVHAHAREAAAPKTRRARVEGPAIRSGVQTAAEGRKQKAPVKATPAVRKQAREHARDIMAAAGPQGRAVADASRKAAAEGRPLDAKDLKNLAKQVTTARDAPASRSRTAAKPAAPGRTPAAPARTPRARSASPARPERGSYQETSARATAAARTAPVAPPPARTPAPPARAPRTAAPSAPKVPVRPGRS